MKRTSSYIVMGFAAALFSLSISGCTALTGLIDAADDFGCPLGKGTNCTTLTATHKIVTKELDEKKSEDSLKVAPPIASVKPVATEVNALKGDLEEKDTPKVASQNQDIDKWAAKIEKHLQEPANKSISSDPLGRKGFLQANSNSHWRNTNGAKARMPERVMFLWVLPWVDTDGDLHGESRLWVKVREAKWGVEKLRLEAMNRGAPEIAP